MSDSLLAHLQACWMADHVLYTSHARQEMRTQEFGPSSEQQVHEAIMMDGLSKEARMKCVICYSPDIEPKTVNEEIWVDQDVALIPLNVLVCNNCGERYYDRKAMRQLEEAEKALKDKRLQVEPTGRVLRVVLEASVMAA